ncbi:MAG: carbamoyltransferase HypF [bacterium]|nr:carbamoyltransferase HypF [bacterium]
MQRLRIIIRGAVQGVGFRPFVFRLAGELQLNGWVKNAADGVYIEVEGSRSKLELFLLRLDTDKPNIAFIQSLEFTYLGPSGAIDFHILPSDISSSKSALVLPDIATCPQCLAEIFNPSDRRSLYPFTNCTLCGPRYSIISDLPYDRQSTSMREFKMCAQCQAEYKNPRDRRFHAQPNACPQCGPHLEFWDPAGRVLASHRQALLEAVDKIRSGSIVAVKGLGGFHLIATAGLESTIQRLRQVKAREEKPFALMFPSLDLIKECCRVSTLEERLLQSSECPIVLLHRKEEIENPAVSPTVAPDNPYLGVMLPYTPLHHLLMRELGFPVIATSGNLADEPICIDEFEALERLNGIADYFLVHNRPIVRQIDDSIVRVVMDREIVLRRARGYAPLPVRVKDPLPSVIAVGGHLKNTIAISIDQNIFLSQHIGDLETAESSTAFEKTISSLSGLYELKPEAIACDFHPDYLSTIYAGRTGLPVLPVQHHYAHILACMADNNLAAPALGAAWDGTGYGTDGTVWGGEFLRVGPEGYERVAYLKTFPLPGGDKAVREPRRTALGLLFEIYGDELWEQTDLKPLRAFTQSELQLLRDMLQEELNTPLTSSAGRLFDALASLIGKRQINRFEGQAAMEIEFLCESVQTDLAYPFGLVQQNDALVVDWTPTFKHIINDLRNSVAAPEIALRFHNSLAEMITAVAEKIGEKRIVLSGGCFQNQVLTISTVQRLQQRGFEVYWHQRIPPNDGGIAVGQIMAAARQLKKRG